MAISRIVLHDWQVKAWNSKKRFIYFVAGVQSGKTTFGVVWILNEAQRCGPGEYIIIAPSYKVLQQSTLVKFLEITPEGYGAYYKAESVYRTIDGRTFFLRSADKPESIEGITARAIWADEASLMKPNIWLMMQGRVSRTQGRILCTFTPISLNWIHREIEKDKERRLRGEEGDIDLIQFRSIDSPYFPKEEYERARRMLTETQFKLRYEGIFGKAEGLVYPDFGPPHIVDDFDVPAEWRRAGGIDWGYNNPFVALKGTLSPDDVLYIYAERYKEREILESHIDFLGSEIGYFGDPSGAQEIAQLRRLGVNVQEANNAVMLGIQKVTERLRPTTDDPKSIRLKIFRSCIHTIDEFMLYRYPEPVGGKIVKDAPVKQDDHCMDALLYLVMGLSKPERRIIWLDDEPQPPTLVEQIEQFKPAEETRPEVLALNTEDTVIRFNAALLAGKIVPQIAAMLKVDIGLLQAWRTSQGEYILKIQRERQAEIRKLAEEIKAGEKQ